MATMKKGEKVKDTVTLNVRLPRKAYEKLILKAKKQSKYKSEYARDAILKDLGE